MFADLQGYAVLSKWYFMSPCPEAATGPTEPTDTNDREAHPCLALSWACLAPNPACVSFVTASLEQWLRLSL